MQFSALDKSITALTALNSYLQTAHTQDHGITWLGMEHLYILGN